MEVSWPGDSGEIHTKLLIAMRDVLFNRKDYAFLGDNARARLENARRVAKNAKMDERMLVHLGGQSYVLFPWLGTRAFRTMRRLLQKNATRLGISDIQSEGCCYITFKARAEAGEHLMQNLCDIISTEGLDVLSLVNGGECPVFDKFDEYIPAELLREAYAADRLDGAEVIERITEGI